MYRNSAVISISLPPKILAKLEKLSGYTAKTRSEVIKDLIVGYDQKQSWERIFNWGRQTKEKFNLQSEADILKLIND